MTRREIFVLIVSGVLVIMASYVKSMNLGNSIPILLLIIMAGFMTYGFKSRVEIYFKKTKNETKRQTVFKICVVLAIVCIIAAISIPVGAWNQPKVQWIMYPFQWSGNTYQIALYFSSASGTFSTGDVIHIDAILSYPNPSPNEWFLLYFPTSLEPKEYNKLVTLQFNPKVNQTSGTIGVPFPAFDYQKFNGPPLATSFDAVWTQEGFQNGFLQIMSTNESKPTLNIVPTNDSSIFRLQFGNQTASKLLIYPLKNAIDIQPSETKLQIKSSDNSLTMTFVVLAVAILAVGVSLNQLWVDEDVNH